MGCASTNAIERPKNIKDFSYCLTENEMSLINALKIKKEEDIKNEEEEDGGDGGNGGDNILILYEKIEIDFTKEDKIYKEYLVFYLPSKFNKESITYDYISKFNELSLLSQKIAQYPKYAKKNNDAQGIERFECNPEDPEDNCENYEGAIKTHIEFKVTEKDLEKRFITIEVSYNIKFKPIYMFYYLSFHIKDFSNPCTFTFYINKNFIIDKYDKRHFTEVSDTKLYSFNNRKNIYVSFRDKKVKINIENELDKNLLSNFTSEEIKQINTVLNTMPINFNSKNLIYQKAIHNIKNNKDSIKIYNIIFYPNCWGDDPELKDESDDYREQSQPIIVKTFKINNKLVKNKSLKDNGKEEISENGDNEKNGSIYGYYYSNNKKLSFYYDFTGTFGLYEFDCESNEDVNNFQLNCNSLLELNQFINYQSFFKYEIILNGNNNIEFSNKDFKYKIKNDKINFEGFLDNYNEQKYIELEKKDYEIFDINEVPMEKRQQNWKELKEKELIPETMKLINK